MAPQETAKLDAILEAVNEHRADFRVLKTELLGGDDGDKPSGRIPALEHKTTNHERRIIRLEAFVLMVAGGALLIKALAWGAEAVAHVVEAFK